MSAAPPHEVQCAVMWLKHDISAEECPDVAKTVSSAPPDTVRGIIEPHMLK